VGNIYGQTACETDTDFLHQHLAVPYQSPKHNQKSIRALFTPWIADRLYLRHPNPVLRAHPMYQLRSFVLQFLTPVPAAVEVKPEVAIADSQWTQQAPKKLE
jgi:hypothetical protein